MLLVVTSAVCAGYLSLFSLSSRDLDGWRAARQRRSVCATRPTPAAAEGRGVLPEVYLAWATDVRLRGNGCAGSSFESQYNWLWASGRFAAF